MFDFLKKRPERKPDDAPEQPNIYHLGGGILLVKWNESIQAAAALKHPLVYRALNKIAESVGQIRWFAEVDPYASKSDQRGKASVIDELNGLLHNPNDAMTASMLRYWMTLSYATVARVPMLITHSATDAKKVAGIYGLEPTLVSTTKDSRGRVVSYKYGSGVNATEYPSRMTWKPGSGSKGFVDQIWKPGITGQMSTEDVNSPLQATGLPAQVITSLLQRAIQTAEGQPNFRVLVTCSQTLTDVQKQALKDHLNKDHGLSGPEAGKIPVLTNVKDLQIHRLDLNLSDIHSKTPSDDMARLIFGAFGIPVALAGISSADGAKFASNYDSSRATFWQDTIIPGYGNPLCQGLTRMLCPPGVRISLDEDSVPALLPARIASMTEAAKITFLTDSEKREMFGFEKAEIQTQTPPEENIDE